MTPERLGDLRASTTSDARLPAEAIIQGERFLVTVEAAGASTIRYFKRNLNLRFQQDSFRRIRSYRLAATTTDPSMLRTPLAYGVFARAGLPVPRVEPVALTVNGRYWGLYDLVEKVNVDFLTRRGIPCHALYMARGKASFAPQMSANLDVAFEVETEPESLAEIESLAELVASPAAEDFEQEIFRRVSRSDIVRYLAAAVLTDHRDGFDKNLFYYSTAAGRPLRLVPWDMDSTWVERAGDTSRVWGDNLLFERVYAILGVRLEVLELVGRALAGEESVTRFSARLEAERDDIARAYEEDPALGGMRGLDLSEQAAALERIYAGWAARLEEDAGEGELLGPR